MKTTLITGTSRGIGLALTKEFAARGWKVYASARNPESADLAALASGTILPLRIDVTDPASIAAAKERIAADTGTLDLLINNAGFFPGERDDRIEQVDVPELLAAMDVNVAGPIRMMQAFLPLLLAAEAGKIVNLSSGAACVSTKEDPDMIAYATTKCALNMLTRAAAADLETRGILLTALSPGWVKTELGGPNAQITPEESARALFDTITALTPADAGQFYGRNHEPYPW